MAEQGRRWRAWRQPGAWSLTGYVAPARSRPGSSGPLRVVLVDDSADVRTLIRTKLRLSGKAVVEGEGADGADAIDLARRLQPDAMLLDVSMPGVDGLSALPRIIEASPETRIVMFSGFDEEPLALRALELGATSYLTKTSSLDAVVNELVHAVTGGDPDAEPVEEDDAEGRDQLDEQVERFQSVFEDAAIGMATMTLHGTIVRANDSLCRILRVGAADLLGSSYGECLNDDAAVADAIKAIVEKGADAVTLEHPQLGDTSLRTTLTVVRDRGGQPLYLFAQCQDVTVQRNIELELRRSQQRFRLMVDVVRDYAIFMLDTEGRVSSWNLGAQRTKGWTADEIIGHHFRVFYPREQQAAHHPEHELEIAEREGVYQEEGWRVRKDGSRFWAHVTITKVLDEEGQHIGFAKVTRDHTERMQMLEQQGQYANQLAEANARLEEANAELAVAAEEQARFLAVTAHELRSPIGVVSMSGKMLAENWDRLDATEREELLSSMQSSAAQLQRLLGDLLTTARLQASSLELDVKEHDVTEVLAPMLQRLRLAHPESTIEPALPDGLRAMADSNRLGQILDNLVANAVAHGRNPIRVAAREDGEHVLLLVSDAGDGVPAELRDRLFERFATGGGERGTGLGLHIVRELARAQGGDATYVAGDNAFVVSLRRAATAS
ncbi:MAG TPA: PAS domain S-box protein [Nocardioides sp.]|uniref:PAS domain S-box protein n=1 Tax=Nocardioides sp. TaxID=35761 RepID=UPI002E33C32A|nr:PAS domain S-box protein [Nocardioides sp.]HEX5087989.1 PAS domain S-box protein [Nocardioides sp.]